MKAVRFKHKLTFFQSKSTYFSTLLQVKNRAFSAFFQKITIHSLFRRKLLCISFLFGRKNAKFSNGAMQHMYRPTLPHTRITQITHENIYHHFPPNHIHTKKRMSPVNNQITYMLNHSLRIYIKILLHHFSSKTTPYLLVLERNR